MSNVNVKQRQRIEKEIASIVVHDAIAAGFTLSVVNGGDDYEIENCGDAVKILETMFLTDDERLYFVRDGKNVGWVYFVYGEEGWDVICDYTVNLEEHLKRASELSEEYMEGKR